MLHVSPQYFPRETLFEDPSQPTPPSNLHITCRDMLCLPVRGFMSLKPVAHPGLVLYIPEPVPKMCLKSSFLGHLVWSSHLIWRVCSSAPSSLILTQLSVQPKKSPLEVHCDFGACRSLGADTSFPNRLNVGTWPICKPSLGTGLETSGLGT